jgi:periplasmic divalent cation tolerance protein
MAKSCSVEIHCPTKKLAQTISIQLVGKRLAACVTNYRASSRYWWKGKIQENKCYIVKAFTLTSKKKQIITVVRKIHSDVCPAIIFSPITANKDYEEWISSTIE